MSPGSNTNLGNNLGAEGTCPHSSSKSGGGTNILCSVADPEKNLGVVPNEHWLGWKGLNTYEPCDLMKKHGYGTMARRHHQATDKIR